MNDVRGIEILSRRPHTGHTSSAEKPRQRALRKRIFQAPLFFAFLLAFLFQGISRAQEEESSDEIRKELEALRERMDELEGRLAETEESTPRIRTRWDRGLRFESTDGKFSMKLGGRIHVDWAALSGDSDLDAFVESHGDDLDDGVKFRRARLTMIGDFYERYIFKASYDFAGGDADFRDVYMGMRDLPLESTLKIGNFKEPFSLESLTQVDGLRFAERSLMRAITPSRNTGVALHGAALNERITWAAGFFYHTDTFGDGRGDLSFTARSSGLLWDEGDDCLFHAGASYSRRGEDDIQFRARPECVLAPDFIDTDGFPPSDLSTHLIRMDSANLYGGEAAWVHGPFSTQAEYSRMDINQKYASDARVSGYYWHGGYFLTGEQRQYRRGTGRFGRVTPHSDFMSPEGGTGAFEVGVRLSRVDLDHTTFAFGGKMTDYTVGLNWFLNSSIRLTLNYIHSHLHGVGSANILVLRTALDF